MNTLFNKFKSENGQSVVEFGLIIPILLVFLLAILEFGWLLNAKITLTSAAREGARTAVVSTYDRNARAYNATVNAVDNVSGIEIPNDSTHFKLYEQEDVVNNVNNIVLEVVGEVTPIIGLFVDDPFILNGKAVMRLE